MSQPIDEKQPLKPKWIRCSQCKFRARKVAKYLDTHNYVENEGKRVYVCNRHFRLSEFQQLYEWENVSHKKIKIRPNFFDTVNQQVKDPEQCCVRTEDGRGPMCTTVPCYELGGLHFCRFHLKRHPGRDKAEFMGRTDDASIRLRRIVATIGRLEKKVDRLAQQLDYLLGFKEFRDSIYEIANKEITVVPAAGGFEPTVFERAPEPSTPQGCPSG